MQHLLITAIRNTWFYNLYHRNYVICFPINAIKFCLKHENIKTEDIDYISYYEKPLLKFDRLSHIRFWWTVITIQFTNY